MYDLESAENKRILAISFYHKYLFLSLSILFIGLVRHFVKVYELSISHLIFCFIYGVLWGIGALYEKWFFQMAISAQTETITENLPSIYIPIIVFSIAFLVDSHTFIKSLFQIIIISVPGVLLSLTITGMMMKLVIDENWSIVSQLIFGVLTVMIYPMDIVAWFKESNVETKYVSSLLQGEALAGSTCALFIYDFLVANKTGWIIHGYQFIMGTVRIIALGVPLGYFFGFIGTVLIKFTYNDASLLMLLTLSLSYTSFFVTSWVSNSGLIGATITGIMMGMEKASLSQEMQENIINFWKFINCILNGIVVIIIGARAPFILLNHMAFKDYIIVLVTYMVSNIARFMAFIVFCPILSRIGYGLTFPTLIICVWCGIKNPLVLTLVLEVQQYLEPQQKRMFFLHIVGLYILTLFVNGGFLPILLRALGLSDISVARQINMNNCMKYIYDARARTIAILKMDRFLSDANWPLVLSSTSLKHPYNKNTPLYGTENDDEENEFFLGYKFTWCPDCQKHIPNEPTPKEFKEMTKEAKMRLLKLKKTSYSRQYENGMLSRDGVRSLHQAVEIAMDTESAYIELDGLFVLFEKDSPCYKYLQTHLQNILQSKEGGFKIPKTKWRIFCFRVTNHLAFYIVMYLVVFANVAYIIPQLWLKELLAEIVIGVDLVFLILYLVEFWLKVCSMAWKHLVKDGLRIYFSTIWTLIEFVIIICTFVDSILELLTILEIKVDTFTMDIIWLCFLAIRTINIFVRLRFSVCCRPLRITISKYLDAKVNKHKALAYELGKNYIAGEEEILENINQIIDNAKIRENLKVKTEEDRLAVCYKLGLSQKEKAWLASTVKTKTAIRTVLNSMKDDVFELKVSGWVDDVEYNKLLASLQERFTYINSIKFVSPSSPLQIFKELIYLGNDEELIEYLYSNVSTKKYDPGVIVREDGEVSDGVYILITGMFKVTFIPNDNIHMMLKDHGALPVIDYICSNDCQKKISDYFVPGNTVGELSTVTGRPYNGEITSETHSEVYFLSTSVVKKAFSMDPDPVNGFECRIWKAIALRRAIDILLSVPSYRSVSQDKLKYLLHRAFVPILSNYKIFIVNEMIQDILVIEGVVIDFNTRDVYTAPCYVPRAVQKLMIPRSSVNVQINIETKLLILPAKEFDEYEIMLAEEQSCELVNTSSTRCLRHLIQDKLSMTSKASKIQKGLFTAATKRLRKRLLGAESTKSKITFAGTDSKMSRSQFGSAKSKALL